MNLFGEEQSAKFPTDYASIIERMQAIDPVRYASTRNFINGGVSYLSPYISRGVISVRQIADAMKAKGYPFLQMEKFLQELAWREYYQRVWQALGDKIFADIKQPQPDVQHQQMITALVNASTGVTAVDSGIQHLYATGYMHNHLRMYLASIACNIGKAHWLVPAQWLYYHLLDGDLASNTCSWQWVAASFANKKYFCNQENINKYTFTNQQHSFLDKPYDQFPLMDIPVALQATQVLDLQTALPQTTGLQLNVDLPTCIYNSYNIDPLWRKDEKVNRVLLLEPTHFAKYPVSDLVMQFILHLAKNISGIQVFVGEWAALKTACSKNLAHAFIFKEHPTCLHYEGVKDERDWMAHNVTGFHTSFFAFWKKAEKVLCS
jgi:deoxyribodipyrimidine photo-lyase